jgi:UTP--glucose-1-phosphate uridylyltransferase
MHQPVTKAVIPAAGFGTRLLPATKAVPKEMLPVVDKPVIQYVVEEALASGITHLILVVSAGKDALRQHLANDERLERFLADSGKQQFIHRVHDIAANASVEYVVQPEQRGLGDAVATAREAVGDQPFAVLLGDTIIVPDEGQPAGLAQLIDVHATTGGSVVSARTVPPQWTRRYGIVDGVADDDKGRLLRLARLVEKPEPEQAPTNWAIAGRYVFTPTIFDELARTAAGKGGEIQLTDAMNALAGREPMHALLWRANRYDVGNALDYLTCIVELGLADSRLGEALAEHLRRLLG